MQTLPASTWIGIRPTHVLVGRRIESEWQHAWRRRQQTPGEPLSSGTAAGVRSARLARLEAALFVADRPLPARLLAQFAMLADAADVKAGVAELNAAYEADDAAFRIELLATGYQLLTRPEFVMWLDR